jgi:hypothetical protein
MGAGANPQFPSTEEIAYVEIENRPSLRLVAPLVGPLVVAWAVVGALIAAHLV